MQDNQLVLIVDDDPSDLDLMKRILTKNDYAVKTAQTAHEALEILEECTPVMVLLDIGLPGMSGLELCTLMKCHEALQRIPVVFLSGRDSPEDYKNGREAGSVFYVSKHRGFDNILTVVKTLSAAHKRTPAQAATQKNQGADLVAPKRHR